jgi:membrane associated rhomboid family serine protease
MLSDRPYLRGGYQREKTSALTWLLSAMIAGFLLQVTFGASWFADAGHKINGLFALSVGGLEAGRIWTLLTHGFLHSPVFIFHVIVNCLALYFLGRELMPILGVRRFVGVYAFATVAGGLAWAVTHWRFGGEGQLIGATAAVEALFIVYACFFPNQQMNFLLFFVVPVTIKPKHIACTLAVVDGLILMLYEIPGARMPFDMSIASSAHLAGMLTGLLYYRYLHRAHWFNPEDRPEVEMPRWMKRVRKVQPAAIEADVVPPASSATDIRAEVDRILDKINSHGFAALTPGEKRVLDEARDLLSQQ